MSLRLRLTLLYSTLMGVILLVISAAVTVVISQLLLQQVDITLDKAQDIAIRNLKMNQLGRVSSDLEPTDVSSDVYMQIWGLDGDLQYKFPKDLSNFENKPFNESGLHEEHPEYRDFSGADWHIRVLSIPLVQNGRRLATLQLASKLDVVDTARGNLTE